MARYYTPEKEYQCPRCKIHCTLEQMNIESSPKEKISDILPTISMQHAFCPACDFVILVSSDLYDNWFHTDETWGTTNG